MFCRCNRLAWLVCVPLLAVAAQEDTRDRAFDLYDAGQFAEARVLLEQLAEDGRADGIAMYRLYYCRERAADPGAAQALDGAREMLEQAIRRSGDLEAYFYLANTYVSLDRPDDRRRVAAEATGKVEAGGLPEPGTPRAMFHLAKLYADQEREIEAVRWYGRAADGLADSEVPGDLSYLRWAARYLADRAYEEERYEEAAKQLHRLLADGSGSFEDWDRLAVSCAWIGRYAEAGRAWRNATRLQPGRSDRVLYGASVAERAAGSPRVARTAPDGRAWAELDQAALEQVLLEQAARVREAVMWARGEHHRLHLIEQVALMRQINEARSYFVAAALEFVLHGYPLRERAFSQGYAALILRESEWHLPPAGAPAPQDRRQRRR